MKCALAVIGLCLLAAAAALPAWHQVQSPCQVSAAAVASATDAWVAGTAGTYLSGFYHWDGSDWALADTFRNQLVYDICRAGADAWAVGEQFNFPDGVVFRWTGEHWQQQDDPFDRTLQAVEFPDSLHGFAAGAAPVTQHPVMKYTDGEWRLDSALVTRRILLGLAFPSATKGYAVGDSGAVFRCEDGTWTQVPSPTTCILRRVAMASDSEGWAVGDGGTILRCLDDTWILAPSPTTHNLRGIAFAGSSGEAWAVGDSGTILHCVQDSWVTDPFVPDPPDVPFYAVSFSSAAHGWAFGYKTFGASVALHFSDPLAVEEGAAAGVRPTPNATIVRSVLRLADGSSASSSPSWLLDAAGRRALRLRPGANDVSQLAPGVYFAAGHGVRAAARVRKVVLSR